jgi:hypothetical protein
LPVIETQFENDPDGHNLCLAVPPPGALLLTKQISSANDVLTGMLGFARKAVELENAGG